MKAVIAMTEQYFVIISDLGNNEKNSAFYVFTPRIVCCILRTETWDRQKTAAM